MGLRVASFPAEAAAAFSRVKAMSASSQKGTRRYFHPIGFGAFDYASNEVHGQIEIITCSKPHK